MADRKEPDWIKEWRGLTKADKAAFQRQRGFAPRSMHELNEFVKGQRAAEAAVRGQKPPKKPLR